jgi:transcription elongation factor GreB
VLHLQKIMRGSLDMLANLVPVGRTVKKCSENQHVQRALEKIRSLLHLSRHGRQSTPDLRAIVDIRPSIVNGPPRSSRLALDMMMNWNARGRPDVKKSIKAADDIRSTGQCFHRLAARREDDRMRKGYTRRPQPDEAAHGKNYITPGGLQRLKDEHQFLLTRDRPAVAEVVAWAAGNGDRSENADYQYGKRRLRQIDGRIRFLTKRIEAAEVVDPLAPRGRQAQMRAFFGATVRYANAAGEEREVSIVGTDEVDLTRNHISFVSPLGRALMKSSEGDTVVLQAPGGTENLTILEVCYRQISVEPFREPPGSAASARTPSPTLT